MKILTDQRVGTLFFRILLSAAVFPLCGAVLIFLRPENAVFLSLAASFCMAAAILSACWRCFQEQERMVEDAAAQIADSIRENRKTSIECSADGALNRLFHEVNSLISILNAHAERERKSKEFLRGTISDISHQLKTPIAALNVYNGILQQTDLPTVREFASLSERELDRIETLVQSLLKMARLDAGVVTLDRKPESVYSLLECVRKQYAFRAAQEGKALLLEDGGQATFLCDRAWLAEAVGNIVKNALDHTQKGGRVLIGWKQSASIVQITVRDDGSGIHPEDLYHIFKRFYRSRFSRDTQGIGLGLPLAKAIIEAHNGSIEVDSRPGEGTVFTINFLIPTKL